jgi:hypothetical protein
MYPHHRGDVQDGPGNMIDFHLCSYVRNTSNLARLIVFFIYRPNP